VRGAKGWALAVAIALAAGVAGSSAAQSSAELAMPAGAAPREPDLIQAIRSLARYCADILLEPTGKARAEYDYVTSAWNDYEPHWHTGQVIWGLVEASAALDDPQFLAPAQQAGHWWVSGAFAPPHPFAGLVNAVHGDKLGPILINWTTISDGTPGLFALSRATGDAAYAAAAIKAGAWLWAHTRVPPDIPGGEGLFYNIIDPVRGVVVTDWNPHRQGPDYDPVAAKRLGAPPIAELARPNIEGFLFADLYRATGEEVWKMRFLEQAEFALRRQSPNGLWMDFEPNDPATGVVHPRFNIWNAEALLEAFALSGDRRFLEAAARTAAFYRDIAKPDGTIHYRLFADGRSIPDSVTGSAVAFNGVLMLRLRDYGVGGFDAAIDTAARWVLANRFADDHPDPNLAGAVINTRYRLKDGRTSFVNRDVGSSFGLRFLALYLRDQRGEDVNHYLSGKKS